MKKTLSLFQRNYDGDRLVRDELVPGAEWVASGEGVATRRGHFAPTEGALSENLRRKPHYSQPRSAASSPPT